MDSISSLGLDELADDASSLMEAIYFLDSDDIAYTSLRMESISTLSYGFKGISSVFSIKF